MLLTSARSGHNLDCGGQCNLCNFRRRRIEVSDTGQVVYQAEKQACHAFPDPKGDGTQAGVKRNFQILSPLDFLAEFT